MSGLKLVSPVIARRTPHCCACNVVCHHIGPPLLCDRHLPPVRERLTTLDLTLRSTA